MKPTHCNFEVACRLYSFRYHKGNPCPPTGCALDTRNSFTSTDLRLLAHDEWERREKRRRIHDMQDWEAGFINGFLTDKKWARELIDKIQKGKK